jgi:hypothetical protein
MSGRPWTSKETAQAQAWRAEGVTHREIGERLGRTRGAVKARFNLLDGKVWPRTRSPVVPEAQEGIAMPKEERNWLVLRFLAKRPRGVKLSEIVAEFPYFSRKAVLQVLGVLKARAYLTCPLKTRKYTITPWGREQLAERGLLDTTLPDGREAQRAAVVQMMLGRAEG